MHLNFWLKISYLYHDLSQCCNAQLPFIKLSPPLQINPIQFVFTHCAFQFDIVCFTAVRGCNRI